MAILIEGSIFSFLTGLFLQKNVRMKSTGIDQCHESVRRLFEKYHALDLYNETITGQR
jgi:hypothetical protein